MKHKIIIEVDHNLKEGEILQYKNGVIRSVEIRELLPEIKVLQDTCVTLESLVGGLIVDASNLKHQVAELRGED